MGRQFYRDYFDDGKLMKPTQLTIQNYRSLVDCTLPLRDLTVVIGPNGAGKTALLEVFQLLRHGSLQELAKFMEAQGGFHALLNHRKGDCIGVALNIDVDSDQSDSPMHYQFELGSRQLGYSITSERLEWRPDPLASAPFHYIDARHGEIYYADPTLPAATQPRRGHDHLELALAQAPQISDEIDALQRMLAHTQLYNSLDVGPRGKVRLPQSLTPTTLPGPDGENLFSALYNLRTSHGDVYDRIIDLLHQGFSDFQRLEFPVVGAGQVTLAWYERGDSQPFYPNQLSEGTLRFLWIAAILLSPHLPERILMDEPEISLHPELLKLLAALLQDASTRSSIIVATHSPDLIRWLEPEEVLIADKEDGATRFTWADQLNLDAWLDEYTLRDLWLMGNLGGRP